MQAPPQKHLDWGQGAPLLPPPARTAVSGVLSSTTPHTSAMRGELRAAAMSCSSRLYSDQPSMLKAWKSTRALPPRCTTAACSPRRPGRLDTWS